MIDENALEAASKAFHAALNDCRSSFDVSIRKAIETYEAARVVPGLPFESNGEFTMALADAVDPSGTLVRSGDMANRLLVVLAKRPAPEQSAAAWPTMHEHIANVRREEDGLKGRWFLNGRFAKPATLDGNGCVQPVSGSFQPIEKPPLTTGVRTTESAYAETAGDPWTRMATPNPALDAMAKHIKENGAIDVDLIPSAEDEERIAAFLPKAHDPITSLSAELARVKAAVRELCAGVANSKPRLFGAEGGPFDTKVNAETALAALEGGP